MTEKKESAEYLRKSRRQTEELLRLFCLHAEQRGKEWVAIQCLLAINSEITRWAGKLSE